MKNEIFDPIRLTQLMVRAQTVNPPGNELELARTIQLLLDSLGLQTFIHEFEPGRANLVAYDSAGPEPRLCFTGHLDTVPFGGAAWRCDPTSGHIDGDRLFGRGASDMKSGIAAFIAALKRYRDRHEALPRVLLVLTAGEETGCDGAKRLAELDWSMHRVGAMIVGEPTGNQCAIGHKGALWIDAQSFGRTAHGAMPELGENAIYHAADAVQRLRTFDFRTPGDPLLGKPSFNVGTISGGLNVNSVPDRASFSIDVRTVGGLDHATLLDDLGVYLGNKVTLRARVDVPPLLNAMDNAWLRQARDIVATVSGVSTNQTTVAYFSDGPVLRGLFGDVPAAIIGPGEPSCAHQTDEWVSVERILQCTEIYERLLSEWYAPDV
ncbi:acetylornithine deacetylase ArgE [Trinickia dabaoshanensis]|uniref:Acetylornithine deacetylase ArgE n=1 Tax=Trinickia dabaoshanensis TaxID=564714 RepID=A0A2N7VE81_9BURK|nr:M20 family metallopeptidase [Trinickia dabaoshanensis]PMS15462.1 acetylornithine deacetylase ArgE [Trinickia dabaoshanensis]